MILYLAFIATVLVASILGGLIVAWRIPGSTHVCRHCRAKLYGPVCEHMDGCKARRDYCYGWRDGVGLYRRIDREG